MRLAEWQEFFIKTPIYIREDAVGGGAITTSSNVAYIPSDVPAVQNELTRLSKKKNKWGITILECPHDYTVSFEDYSNIVVPVSLWENFKNTIFGTSILPEGPFEVDLSGYLAEALNDEVEESLQILRNVTVQFLNSDIVISQRHKVASLVKDSGDKHLNFSTEGQSAIKGVNTEQQLRDFLQLVQTSYKQDVGSIQLVTTALQQRAPLTEVPLFEQYDNLISVVLNGTFSGIPFIYKSVIELDFTAQESLQLSNPDLLRKLSANTQFKVQGSVVYPTSPKGFPSNIIEVITTYLKGNGNV